MFGIDVSKLKIGIATYSINIGIVAFEVTVNNEYLSDNNIRISSNNIDNITKLAYYYKCNDTLIRYDLNDKLYVLGVYGNDLLEKTAYLIK